MSTDDAYSPEGPSWGGRFDVERAAKEIEDDKVWNGRGLDWSKRHDRKRPSDDKVWNGRGLDWNALPFIAGEPGESGQEWARQYKRGIREGNPARSDTVDAAADTTYGLNALSSEASIVATAPEGTRNDALNKAWFRMGKVIAGGSLTVETAHKALVDAARAAGLPQKEIDATLRTDATSGLVQGSASPRVPPPLVDAPSLTVIDDAEHVAAATLMAALDAEFIDRDDLGNLPTPEPLIETVLPRHAYGILRGRDQSFKSFVALDWALCLATGRPWQGHWCERVRVLYIAGEGAYGLAKRVDAWESANGTTIPVGAFTVRKSAMSMFKPNVAFPHLVDKVDVGEYGLVVVDTLRRVSGSADGNGSDMGAVVDNLDRIKRATLNGTVLAIAHTDKGDNDTRGYSGIEDDADVVWEAKRDDSLLMLRNTKQKDGPEHSPIHLRSRSVLDSLVLDGSEAVAETTTESQIAIIATMQRSFRDGTSGTPLKEACNLPKSTYFNALGDLVSAGRMVKSGSRQRPFYELAKDDAK